MHLGREITHGAPKAVWEAVEATLGHAGSSASANPHLISGLEGGFSIEGPAPFLP